MKPKSMPKRDTTARYDRCQTPGYAVQPLIPHLQQLGGYVWEAACGEGYLVKAMTDADIPVLHSDIEAGQDFYTHSPFHNEDVVAQVTNPGYSHKYDWLERSYELNKATALLLPAETISSEAGRSVLEKVGLDLEIIYLYPRVNFRMPDLGWTGPENRAKWLDHWVAVRREQGITNPKRLYATPTAQFPVAWFTWGLNIGQQISYATLKRKPNGG